MYRGVIRATKPLKRIPMRNEPHTRALEKRVERLEFDNKLLGISYVGLFVATASNMYLQKK